MNQYNKKYKYKNFFANLIHLLRSPKLIDFLTQYQPSPTPPPDL